MRFLNELLKKKQDSNPVATYIRLPAGRQVLGTED
jgi:hypothetical protein